MGPDTWLEAGITQCELDLAQGAKTEASGEREHEGWIA